EDFGMKRAALDALKVQDPTESLALVQAALTGSNEAASDMVALNAGAAIYASGVAGSLANGVAMAQDAIGSGQASEKLKEFVAFTQQLKAASE
ncbi:MAG: anthranilate phosphoribosyltransferase, partial [Pseudomonadales bacterium]